MKTRSQTSLKRKWCSLCDSHSFDKDSEKNERLSPVVLLYDLRYTYPELLHGITYEDKLLLKKRILKYGVPKGGHGFCVYRGYILSYDHARRIPSWTAAVLTKDNLNGPATRRKRVHFMPDPFVNPKFSSDKQDYKDTIYDKGHMMPSSNLKHSQSAMDESFYLSNIVPHHRGNNNGFWNRLELFCNDLVSKFDEVRVFTGTLFLPDGKKCVKHQVIGDNNVHVPTHFYKIVIAERTDENWKATSAFVVPNEDVHTTKKLTDFQVRLSDLESKAGIEFIPNLPKATMIDISTVVNNNFRNNGLDYFATCTTPKGVKREWKNAGKDKSLKPARQKRLNELQEKRKSDATGKICSNVGDDDDEAATDNILHEGFL